MLIFCLPLFLCAAMFSVVILPAMMPAGSTDRSPEAAPDARPSLSSVVMVEALKDDFACTHTDHETVREIINILESITAVNEGFEHDSDAPDGNAAAQQEEGYTVVLTDEAGNEKTYVLTEYALIEQLTGTKYDITADELAELRKALGVPAE